jgi:hypothetical protein
VRIVNHWRNDRFRGVDYAGILQLNRTWHHSSWWDTLEAGGAAQQCAARLLYFPADNFAAIGSNGVSLRF